MLLFPRSEKSKNGSLRGKGMNILDRLNVVTEFELKPQ